MRSNDVPDAPYIGLDREEYMERVLWPYLSRQEDCEEFEDDDDDTDDDGE